MIPSDRAGDDGGADRLSNGEFYAKGDVIFKAPVKAKTEAGTTITMGFPVCTVSEYVSAADLIAVLEAGEKYDALVSELIAANNELAARKSGAGHDR